MKVIHSGSGTFRRRLFFEKHEIDDIAVKELKRVDLLPDQPSPIRIDRFIEKRFGIWPSFQELPHGILGYSRFTEEGCKEIVVSKTLSESVGFVAERRVSSTLAHEAGHALLHSDLFVDPLSTTKMKMITNEVPSNQQDILCRSDVVGDIKRSSSHSGYQGDWWEYQANLMIGALLLPRPLLRKSLTPNPDIARHL